MEGVFSQPGTGVRCEWGHAGAAELGRVCAAMVVVDVLSFTTATCVAVSRGVRVHPFPWGEQAHEYAKRVGAVVATGRSAVTAAHPWSMSPAALATAPAIDDLVLPSPNGFAICAAAGATGIPVVAASLLNARAVAGWLLASGYGTTDAPIGVIAAGERWPDGELRPAIEDLLGAAAVIDGMTEAPAGLSLEAAVALGNLNAMPDVPATVRRCVSAQELIARGFGDDVEIAVRRDVSDVVPLLRGGAFVPAPPATPKAPGAD